MDANGNKVAEFSDRGVPDGGAFKIVRTLPDEPARPGLSHDSTTVVIADHGAPGKPSIRPMRAHNDVSTTSFVKLRSLR